jgi:tetratricopeptide (TPR) repeat protein
MVAPALGAGYTLGGRVTEAVLLLTRALEHTMTMETAVFQTLCGLSLGEAQRLAGRLQEAQTQAERALVLAGEHRERGNEAYALRLLGEIAAHRDPPESAQAEVYYRQALALADKFGMLPLQAHCHLGLGELYVKTGRHDAARVELTAAIEMYRAMEMTFWLPQAEVALAEVEGR